MFIRYLVFFIFIMTNAFSANSSEMRFDVYDIDKGLVQETVRGIIQDQKGFLWIGTEEGLNRFDGFAFTSFRHDPEDPETLSYDVITDMVIDNEGKIWIGTFGGGINRFDPQNSKVERLNSDQLSSDRIESLFIDSRQHIWVGTSEHGLDLIIPAEGDYDIVNFKLQSSSLNHPSINAFAEDQQGNIWVGSDSGINIYHPDTGTWERFTDDSVEGKFENTRVRSLLADAIGNIWIGTASNGLYRYFPGNQQLTHFVSQPDNANSLGNNRVLSLLQDKENNIWIGTDDGVTLFKEQRFRQIKHSDTNPNSLSNNRILSIFEDNSGLIWLGTFRGLNKWNPITDRFNHTLPRVSEKYNHAVITAFAQFSNQDLVIATYGGGILVKNYKNGQYQLYTQENGLPDNRIMTLHVDKQDGLWVGTRANGLAYLPQNSSRWQYFEHDESDSSTLPANGVTDIFQDSRGDIWVTTYNGGLSKKVANGFETYSADPDDPRKLSSSKVMQVHEDREGNLWLATEAGLNMLDLMRNQVFRYQHDATLKSSLSSDMVWHMFEDSSGNFWIATEGNGVNFWSHKDRLNSIPKFKHIQRKDGLLSNTVYGFSEDNEGRIWMSSNKGLSRYNPSTGNVEHFDKGHGLQGYDFNIGAVMKGRDNNIYFGGSNGFNQFSSDFDPIASVPPNVELLSATGINNKHLPGYENAKLKLAYNDYLVAFDFVALDFAAPEKNLYQYKLENFDKDWLEVGNLRRATYTNLPAGKYTFMVKAANHNGKWSDPQVFLPMVVEPAPWLTVWAFAGYAAIISAIILMLIQHQLRKFAEEESQRKKLEREVAERTKELAEQNNKLTSLNNELEIAYRVDALTGLSNRHFLNAYLGKRLTAIDQAHVIQGKDAQHMLIMLLDMDNLKPINDTFGHAAGDAAICHLARMIQDRIPKEFHLIRWGGDEFMLVGEIKDKKETCVWIENLFDLLKAGNFFYFKQKIELTCSAGYAFYPFDYENPRALSWDQVSMVADKALYSAKMDKGHWCGVVGPTREINELYLNELLRCKHIKEVSGLVQMMDI